MTAVLEKNTHLRRLLASGGPWRTAKTPALGRGSSTEVATSPTANTFSGPPAVCRNLLMRMKPNSSALHRRVRVYHADKDASSIC